MELFLLPLFVLSFLLGVVCKKLKLGAELGWVGAGLIASLFFSVSSLPIAVFCLVFALLYYGSSVYNFDKKPAYAGMVVVLGVVAVLFFPAYFMFNLSLSQAFLLALAFSIPCASFLNSFLLAHNVAGKEVFFGIDAGKSAFFFAMLLLSVFSVLLVPEAWPMLVKAVALLGLLLFAYLLSFSNRIAGFSQVVPFFVMVSFSFAAYLSVLYVSGFVLVAVFFAGFLMRNQIVPAVRGISLSFFLPLLFALLANSLSVPEVFVYFGGVLLFFAISAIVKFAVGFFVAKYFGFEKPLLSAAVLCGVGVESVIIAFVSVATGIFADKLPLLLVVPAVLISFVLCPVVISLFEHPRT